MPLSTCTGEDAGESDCERSDAGRWMKRPVSDSKELKTNMISAAAEKTPCALRPVPEGGHGTAAECPGLAPECYLFVF